MLRSSAKIVLRTLSLFAIALAFNAQSMRAQGTGDAQARVTELKESMARNKEALATYTWEETVKIILKGEEKKTEHFEVRQGPDGKSIKTSLDPAAPAPQQPQGGRFKQKIVAKKKEEFKEYADQMKELAGHYVPPDKDAIQASYAKGNLSVVPGGGAPGEVKMVIKDYYKPGDLVTLRYDKNAKMLQAITINSWMDDPKDVMNLTVSFSKLADGTNHVASSTIEGVAKQLTVNTSNSEYKKM